ncbi:hypothetical protein [Rhizobium phage RHEph27]|uniref:Lipoprotein n=2 Tax=Tepoztlanvirus TaxID=3424906 RepID=A0A7S5RA32_9CAUD|nr:hypothetical protein EVB35_047 [Rhizobium phage RHph_TM34]QIG68324.1 hypothetical protein EVB57_047 [Rhizobium phage RHph_Y1_20]QIG69993.1 hypothetical protein EVB84_049 [Rhizobium phage RHph_Y48]QIG70045.1 hypothetical protein EVB85_049 [Rhizobium phage RHph_Y86]QIG70097.1 hypothetical protein EVB86_049 [Rhizobium phage RHph_Y2_7]QXV75002.1 hypothetical protein [Rhizobium phage RHEph27]
MRKYLACLLLLVVTSCASGPTSNWCLLNQPIRYTQTEIDHLSDTKVEEGVQHNRLGAKLCGWTA